MTTTEAGTLARSAPAGGPGDMPTLRDAIEAAKGPDPICYDMDKVWDLADLLDPLEPTATGWAVDIAEAALILFGDVQLGLADLAARWLWYVQNAMTILLGPSDERTLAASHVVARRCWKLGLYDQAAVAWQTLVVANDHHGRPDAADEARLERAVCLYGLGRCREATTLLEQAWNERLRTGRARPPVEKIPLVYIEMLRLCWRRDEARTVWQAAAKYLPTTDLCRYLLLDSYRQVLDARAHDASCTARHRLPQPRRAGGQAPHTSATTVPP